MKSIIKAKNNHQTSNPQKWLVPRRWPNTAGLGPWLDKGLSTPYPLSSGSAFFPRNVWQLETQNSDQVIPKKVWEMLTAWRPTPIREACGLRAALGIKSRILFKDESSSPTYSYKANAALPQAWFAAEENIKGLMAYTLAGYWGLALAWACAQIGLDCRVMIPQQVFSQRPDLMHKIKAYGADLQCVSSRPSPEVLSDSSWRFAVGCFLNAVVAFNSIIGVEAVNQLDVMGIWPDVLVGACGGGTNFAGLVLGFLACSKATKHERPRLIAVEPSAVGKLKHGILKPVRILGLKGPIYNTLTLNGDPNENPDGYSSWAPGLTYPTTTPLIVTLASQGFLRAYECTEKAAKEAARLFAETEGIRSAPEAAYAIWGGIEVAKHMDKSKSPGTVLFCLSGGHRIDE
jgi:tryptophan synthase beta chain